MVQKRLIEFNKKRAVLLFIPLFYIVCTVIINFIGEKKDTSIPVENATSKSWDKLSFWYYPWGKSGIHKGIDIFAPHKTPIYSPINGFVLSAGYSNNGGNYANILNSKMRTYYFAHLNSLEIKPFQFVKKGQIIGTVGNTGNAISTPYHLHFSIFSLAPILKYYDGKQPSGWKKMFYLNPNNSLIEK